jgi:cytochrome d ubiquinol oxidase subunit I
MDAVLLARIQFALTVGFHFLFPPLAIGLGWLIFGLMTRYRRSGSEEDKRNAQFWTRLFTIGFVVGVASGITMEFQFGTNWARYSRVVGDIFGAPLAIETIFTFFLESTFLAVLALGWNRFPRGVQWFASLMVAVGATLSAVWILVANSWMQTPAGFVFNQAAHRAELTDFFAAVFNPSTLPRILHTVDAALMTASFFMLGISAMLLRRKTNVALARTSLYYALVVAFVTALLQLGTGHYHAVQVAVTQPTKLAAFEGLFTTQANAPLLLFGIPDARRQTVHLALRVPGALSWLATGKTSGTVKGLKDYPRDLWPPISMTFYPFHLMVLLGLFFVAVPLLGLFLRWRKVAIEENPFYLGLLIFTLPLPFLANELGWIAAEVGRQPWAVYNVLRTADAISVTTVVPGWQVFLSLLLFVVIDGVLLAAWFAFLRREIFREPKGQNELPEPEVSA